MVPMGLAAAILNRTDPLAQAVGAIASREMQRGGATAQEKVAQALASHLPTDADQTPIIFLYAGVSGLSRVLDSVRELRQRYPKAEIYLVGCDCDRSSRFPAILAVVSAQHAIITPECGGRNTMEDIVAALIDRWPKQPLN